MFNRFIYFRLFSLFFLPGNSNASKLAEILPVDDHVLVLHFQDGMVQYNWDDTICGSCNGWNYYYTENWHLCPDKDQYIPFGEPLNTALAQQTGSYTIVSEEDANYGAAGQNPVKVYRKSKVWEASHDEQKPVMHHWIYLELPPPVQHGKSYTLKINADINSGEKIKLLNFDEYALESPAIKISNIGYEATAPQKQPMCICGWVTVANVISAG